MPHVVVLRFAVAYLRFFWGPYVDPLKEVTTLQPWSRLETYIYIKWERAKWQSSHLLECSRTEGSSSTAFYNAHQVFSTHYMCNYVRTYISDADSSAESLLDYRSNYHFETRASRRNHYYHRTLEACQMMETPQTKSDPHTQTHPHNQTHHQTQNDSRTRTRNQNPLVLFLSRFCSKRP